MTFKEEEKDNLLLDIVDERILDVKPVTFKELEIITKQKQNSM